MTRRVVRRKIRTHARNGRKDRFREITSAKLTHRNGGNARDRYTPPWNAIKGGSKCLSRNTDARRDLSYKIR